MEKPIIDGMRKEAKPTLIAAIIGYILAILTPILFFFLYSEEYSTKDLILIFAFYFILSSVALYGWFYSAKYKITEEKVNLKTLFRKIEINLKDVTCYTCKRYRKSVFYQFRLYTNDKSILINTRYKGEFEEILKENKIEQKTK